MKANIVTYSKERNRIGMKVIKPNSKSLVQINFKKFSSSKDGFQ